MKILSQIPKYTKLILKFGVILMALYKAIEAFNDVVSTHYGEDVVEEEKKKRA